VIPLGPFEAGDIAPLHDVSSRPARIWYSVASSLLFHFRKAFDASPGNSSITHSTPKRRLDTGIDRVYSSRLCSGVAVIAMRSRIGPFVLRSTLEIVSSFLILNCNDAVLLNAMTNRHATMRFARPTPLTPPTNPPPPAFPTPRHLFGIHPLRCINLPSRTGLSTPIMKLAPVFAIA
jgi:hypothetical protein